MRRRGFSFIELLLAAFIAVMAIYAFMTVFSNSSKHALQTRNRTTAILHAQSLMDEIEVHPYGSPAPKSWQTGVQKPVTLVVHGRPQEMSFNQQLSFENGSFVGQSANASDLVTIRITWKESAGGNKELVVRVPVWR
jgi:Tfp pilus assembly protein PilV